MKRGESPGRKGETKAYKHMQSGRHVGKVGGWRVVIRMSLPALCGKPAEDAWRVARLDERAKR